MGNSGRAVQWRDRLPEIEQYQRQATAEEVRWLIEELKLERETRSQFEARNQELLEENAALRVRLEQRMRRS